MLIIRAILIVTVSAIAVEADIYRYVDDDGVAYYTDVPLNRKAERIIRTGPAETQKDTQSTSLNRVETGTGGDFHSIVMDKANKYEIEPSLVHAVIKAESNGNPSAVSKKGAMGLMQLMPTTASELDVRNAFDPEENIDGGTKYLKYLIEKFRGDLTLALAAYNAGPKLVEKTGSIPQISETKQYVKKVLSIYTGKTFHPVSSPGPSPVSKPERIYKIVTEDGTLLFTNFPLYKNNPRF